MLGFVKVERVRENLPSNKVELQNLLVRLGLRDEPNIKWGKDGGKEGILAPWYHLGSQYGGEEGDRINGHHLTLAEKSRKEMSNE